MSNFKLSPGLTQLRHARRCLQELEVVIDSSARVSPPVMSDELTELLQFNSQFIDKYSLAEAVGELDRLIKSAVTFEVIVATEPSASFLQELTKWFRDNLHPQALLNYKVRRSIGGGAIIRTPNRIYDFSLRPKLQAGKSRLTEVLRRV